MFCETLPERSGVVRAIRTLVLEAVRHKDLLLDHGSKHTKPAQLIQKIGESDVLVLSVSFSPALAELGHDVKDSSPDQHDEMVSALVMAIKAFKKNVAKEVAEDERRRVHNLCRRQALRSAGDVCGEGRAQPLSDYLQPHRSDSRPAHHSRAHDAGLQASRAMPLGG